MSREKIKILMFSAGVISGAFRMMMDIIKHVDKKKFQIIVAYKPEYAQWDAYEKDSITTSGIKLLALRGKSLFDPRGFIDLWNILHDEKIDIIHSWDVLGVPARIIGKFAKVKIVEEIANPPPIPVSQISLKHYLINRMTSVLVDGFVACSNEIMNRYHEKKCVYLKGRELAVVHNCVEVPSFEISAERIAQIRKDFDLRDHEVILTNIGYFNEQKAQTDLLLAFKEVVNSRSDVRLFIIGWGRLEQKLVQLAKQLELQDRVIFTGKLNRQQVFEILSMTDLFVLSSHWEGFGIVLAEAMALGKPVVSTDTDGGREVVQNGKTGIIVPTKDPPSLAEGILHLLGNPELMLQMGREGLKRVNELFNCEQFAEGYERFYESVFSVN